MSEYNITKVDSLPIKFGKPKPIKAKDRYRYYYIKSTDKGFGRKVIRNLKHDSETEQKTIQTSFEKKKLEI